MRRRGRAHHSSPQRFQVTHPVWGATHTKARNAADLAVSIHAPRVGCDIRFCFGFFEYAVSIHAPRVGCDLCVDGASNNGASFQFTHPVWGATGEAHPAWADAGVSIHAPRVGCDSADEQQRGVTLVSIHAPRVGCDTQQSTHRVSNEGFNSRTPCGVRRICHQHAKDAHGFNSRTPCGVRHLNAEFSAVKKSFNSRTPCGVRPIATSSKMIGMRFQFTHPVWGATFGVSYFALLNVVSIHAPRVGCDYRWCKLLLVVC